MATKNRLEDQLSSMIPRKGAAARPAEIPQRGEPAPVEPPKTEPPKTEEPSGKQRKQPDIRYFTLRLEKNEAMTLKAFALKREETYQEILRKAVNEYIQRNG